MRSNVSSPVLFAYSTACVRQASICLSFAFGSRSPATGSIAAGAGSARSTPAPTPLLLAHRPLSGPCRSQAASAAPAPSVGELVAHDIHRNTLQFLLRERDLPGRCAAKAAGNAVKPGEQCEQ